MRKEFSFYEFVALLIPGSILLFGISMILKYAINTPIFDFEKLGETVVFIIICYGIGHLIQAIGNIYEKVLWGLYKGMPTSWLVTENRFKERLFTEPFNQKVLNKLEQKFGAGMSDYGGLTYNLIFQSGKTERIDIFNGNYSLFRGLSITFLLLTALSWYYFNIKIALLTFIPFILLSQRMIRFAKYYATEIFVTFYNTP